MIAIIGGPSKEEDTGKKPGLSMTMKMKPKKIGGIGGEYANETDDSQDTGMDTEAKMLEAARPLAKAMGVPSSVVVDSVTAICNLMHSAKSDEAEPVETEEGND